MAELDDYRKQIDDLDDHILELLNKRAEVVLKVGQYKADRNMDLYVPSRERLIFERLRDKNKGPFPTDAIRRVFREIISASLAIEHPLSAAYLGPKATFTHIAAMQQFGHSANLNPCKTIPSVFEEVSTGRAQYGVVPVENSNEGAVTHTLDMFLESDMTIIAENYLEVSLDLLSRTGRQADIRTIYSHPQAINQCKRWLNDNCPNIPVVEVSSTARAAQMVADDESGAAIANGAAANLYGLQSVAAKIVDNRNNFTRFIVIGKKMPAPCGKDKTSIMFSFHDKAGALSMMLEPFRVRGLNLMKIESRPLKSANWKYLFFVDIEGHVSEPAVSSAIEDLRPVCTIIKVLGSYPRAR